MLEALLTTLGISLAIQAVFFVFAATLRTDKVTDLSYSLSFVVLAVLLLAESRRALPHVTLAIMVGAWGLRLAAYLFYRILAMGRDARFDGIREHFWKFFQFWLLQGMAVWIIMWPTTLWFAGAHGSDWSLAMTAGLVIWLAGLVIETTADLQKFRFKSQPGASGRWIDTGLWRHSRHPNYFGELLCWWGVLVYVAPDLGPWLVAGVVGPLTITSLLLFGTGIPTLERSASEKWGRDPDYEAYRRRTNLLIPWPRRG
jgi:steroid 5-alpha reductase family enzyme